jgi:hypothetical protein
MLPSKEKRQCFDELQTRLETYLLHVIICVIQAAETQQSLLEICSNYMIWKHVSSTHHTQPTVPDARAYAYTHAHAWTHTHGQDQAPTAKSDGSNHVIHHPRWKSEVLKPCKYTHTHTHTDARTHTYTHRSIPDQQPIHIHTSRCVRSVRSATAKVYIYMYIWNIITYEKRKEVQPSSSCCNRAVGTSQRSDSNARTQ